MVECRLIKYQTIDAIEVFKWYLENNPYLNKYSKQDIYNIISENKEVIVEDYFIYNGYDFNDIELLDDGEFEQAIAEYLNCSPL